MPNIICSGFGGQGVLTAGLILAKTGMDIDKNVTWIPSYGSEMRGGTANCNIKIFDEKIASPFVKKIDILVAMNTPSVAKFEPLMKSGGLIVANKSMIKDWTYREDIRVIEVEATHTADSLGYTRGANIVMLGGLASSGELFEVDTLQKGINEFFAAKGKSNDLNDACFLKGIAQAQ